MRRRAIHKALASLVMLVAIEGCGVDQLISGVPAAKSLAKIQVKGFTKTGQENENDAGGTVATGAYIGPVLSRSRIGHALAGPGVRVEMFSANSDLAGNAPGIISVGIGTAPQACKLEVEQFLRKSMPYTWFDITADQLGQIRSGKRMLLLIATVCGTG